MSALLEWLLDLDQLRLGDPGPWSLQWQQPLDPWLWFVTLIIVPAYVLLIYRNDGGRISARVLMATCRTLLILLIMLLLCRPVLVQHRDRMEPSSVAVVIDASASMALSDSYPAEQWQHLKLMVSPPQPQANVCSRWDVVTAVWLGGQRQLLHRLLARHNLRLFGFGGSAVQQAAAEGPPAAPRLIDAIQQLHPTEPTTDLAGALEHVFDACIDAHLLGIVLVTDGQQTRPATWERLTRLSISRAVPLYIIAVGSPTAPPDVAIRDSQVDPFAYAGDTVAVRCTVAYQGLAPDQLINVVLRTADSGVIHDQRSIVAADADGSTAIELQVKTERTAVLHLVVEAAIADSEINTDNNLQALQIRVVEDRIRVLFIDGYPRFEYRYLKNTLLREPSVVLSTLLLSADEQFVQEGDLPIRRLPNSAEELDHYDVILMGDVDPDRTWISMAQMALIREWVAEAGGGFGIIAGQWFTPQRLSGTPLAQLIAVEPAQHSARPAGTPFRPILTAAGRDSPLLRLVLDPQQADNILQRLPPWYWYYPAESPRAGSEVLLQHPEAPNTPLMVVGQYGAGRLFYQGSDDSWRWRRDRGEGLFDSYWLQVLRYLGANKKFQPHRQVILHADRRRVPRHVPIILSLELGRRLGLARLPGQVPVAIHRIGGQAIGTALLTAVAPGARQFQGEYLPPSAGAFEARFDPRGIDLDLAPAQASFEVEQQTVEYRKPQADLALLEQLADKTRGLIVPPWDAQALPDLIPERQFVIPDDVTETLWDSRLALGVFVLLIVSEWVLRKLNGLT